MPVKEPSRPSQQAPTHWGVLEGSKVLHWETIVLSINEAGWDRVLRVLLGVVLLYLGWSGAVGGTLGWIFKFGGFVPLVTGIVGWCALYAVLGVTTCSRIPDRA